MVLPLLSGTFHPLTKYLWKGKLALHGTTGRKYSPASLSKGKPLWITAALTKPRSRWRRNSKAVTVNHKLCHHGLPGFLARCPWQKCPLLHLKDGCPRDHRNMLGLLVQSLFLLLNPTMTLSTPGLSPRHPQGLSLQSPALPCLHILRFKLQQPNRAHQELTR